MEFRLHWNIYSSNSDKQKHPETWSKTYFDINTDNIL